MSRHEANLRLRHMLDHAREAGRVPAEARAHHPDIPWPEIVGLRNRLIHGYDSVDLDILWQIVTEDMPLIATLEKALE